VIKRTSSVRVTIASAWGARIATAPGDANPFPARHMAHHLAQHRSPRLVRQIPANPLSGHGLVLSKLRRPRATRPILVAPIRKWGARKQDDDLRISTCHGKNRTLYI